MLLRLILKILKKQKQQLKHLKKVLKVQKEKNNMSFKSKFIIGITIVCIILFVFMANNIFSFNQAGKMKVIQYPSGKLITKIEPGLVWQFFGEEFNYMQFATVGFGNNKGEGSADVTAIDVIFNDASTANISMMARVELPSNPEQLISIKKRFSGGYEHFIKAGAVPVISNIVKTAANLRSSQEAYTTLAQFKSDIEMQLAHGNYATKSVERWITKATGDSERVRVTEIIMKDGIPVTTTHDLITMGCKVTIQDLAIPNFDDNTKEMINRRKQESLQTEVRKQQAIRAEQDKITAIAQGEAAAAQARAEAEVIKTKAVTEAEQQRDVSRLQKEGAEYYRQKLILEGQGEAEKRKLIMSADGALEIRLKAEVEKERIRMEGFRDLAKAGVRLVPEYYINGSGDGKTPTGFENYLQMMSAGVAKDISKK